LIPGSCEVDLNVYDGILSTLLILRGLFGLLVWQEWRARKRTFTKRTADVQDKRRWEHRVPFIPVLSSAMVVTWLLVVLLVRFNQSNAHNGVTLLLWTIAFNGYAIYSMLFQRRVIRLGKKIIPLARAKLDDMTKQSVGNNSPQQPGSSKTISKWDELASFDSVQVAIVCLQLCCVALQFLCGIVLGLIFPGSFLWLQVAYASEGIYIGGSVISLIYQLERVYRCVVESQMDDKTKGVVRKKFRSQQLHFLLIGCAGVAVNVILTIGVFPSRWYTLVYWIVIESSVSSLSVIDLAWSFCLRKRKKAPASPQMTSAVIVAGGFGADTPQSSSNGGNGNAQSQRAS